METNETDTRLHITKNELYDALRLTNLTKAEKKFALRECLIEKTATHCWNLVQRRNPFDVESERVIKRWREQRLEKAWENFLDNLNS